MNIARTAVYTTAGTAARLLAGLVAVKLVASFAGPAGVGKLGQFMSLMSLLAVLAGGGISAAIVKYVAEYRQDPQKLSRLLATALSYVLGASCVVGGITLLFSRQISLRLLGDSHDQSLIRILVIALFGIALLNYIMAVINGFMDVRRLALIQLLGSFIGIAMMLWLSRWLHLYGALLALVIGQLLWLVVGLPAWWRSPYFRRSMWQLRFDREMTRRLASFSVMTITSALLPPIINIAVRDHLAARFGWEQVGYWQAVSKVSDAYLLFLTTAINIYYLPKLAATHERALMMRELRHAYRLIVPVVIAMATAVYLCRDEVTRLLFSACFRSANPLYGPQLIGDVIKIASFILSYVMLAKAMTRLFVISEFVFAGSYLVLVYVFTAHFGLAGAIYAFSVNYFFYLLFNVLVARRYLGAM